jgi:PIN domain nuclease of toxin-antitoxin system
LKIAAVADTHIVIWDIFNDPRLSASASTFMEQAAESGNKIAVSEVSLAEIVYWVEKARVPSSAFEDLLFAISDPEHVFQEAPFTADVVRSMQQIPRSQVPDMPDRMIAATALHLGVPAITRDGRIRATNLKTIL